MSHIHDMRHILINSEGIKLKGDQLYGCADVDNEERNQNDDRNWDDAGPLIMFNRDEVRNRTDFGPNDVDYARAARKFYFNSMLSSDKVARCGQVCQWW